MNSTGTDEKKPPQKVAGKPVVVTVSLDASLLESQLAQLSKLLVEVPRKLARSVLRDFVRSSRTRSADFFFRENVAAPGTNSINLRIGIVAVEFDRLLVALGASKA